MAEPTHGEILAQLAEVKTEIRHLADLVAALQADNNEWKAIKAGAGIARWGFITLIAVFGAIAGLIKLTSGGQG